MRFVKIEKTKKFLGFGVGYTYVAGLEVVYTMPAGWHNSRIKPAPDCWIYRGMPPHEYSSFRSVADPVGVAHQ